MDSISRPDALNEAEIDWQEARSFLRQYFRRKLGGLGAADIEDLTQDAAIRLVRAIRRESIRNLEAMMTTVAHRTTVDHFRKRERARILAAELQIAVGDRPHELHNARGLLGDLQGRVEFIVLEFFSRQSSHCRELARAFFSERDWREVASSLGKSHDAIRARWSRCVKTLRKAVAQDPGLAPLGDWASD